MDCEKTSYLLHNMLEQAFGRVIDLSALFNIRINTTGKSPSLVSVIGDFENDLKFMDDCLRTIIQCCRMDSVMVVDHESDRSRHAMRVLITPALNNEKILPLLSARLDCFKHDVFHVRCSAAAEQRLSIDFNIALNE